MVLLGLSLDAWITIVTLVAVIYALLFTRLRADVVFLGAVLTLFVTGVLDATEAFSGFISNPVLVIGTLCVIVAGISYTGVLQWLTRHVLGRPKGEGQTLGRLMLSVAVLSSCIGNNTVTMLFVGIVKMWTRKYAIKASRLLIPVSYAAQMGGILLIFVTPSSLVVSGMYTSQTGQTMSSFDPFLPALICMVVVMLVVLVLRGLLPNRNSSDEAFEKTEDYTLEMMVASNNPHVGESVGALGLNRVHAGSLVELIHFDNERHVMPVSDDEPLMGGDHLIFAGKIDELLELAIAMKFVSPDRPVFSLSEPRADRHLRTAYVCFGSRLIGTRLAEGSFEADHGMMLVAVSRRGERINQPPREVLLQAGDSLLFASPLRKKIDTDALKADLQFFDMPDIPVKGRKPLISSVILIAMVILAVSGVMPQLQSACIAAGAMLVFGCCSPSQAMNAINWKLLLTVGGGITLGVALQKTGIAAQLAPGILGICGGHPFLVMIAFCLVGAIVTEFISNAATAALLFPVMAEVVVGMQCDLLPFAIVLILAVNSAFITPFGTPLNLMVYGPGDYSSKDFLRIGLPVKLAYLATAMMAGCLLI